MPAPMTEKSLDHKTDSWLSSMSPTTASTQLGRLNDDDFFFISNTHAEALARLDFFVRQQWNFALLQGVEGSGRSSTLRAFKRRPIWQSNAIAIVDAGGISPIKFLQAVAQRWKIDCLPTDSLRPCWTAIEQTLHRFWYSRTLPLVLVDNIDLAPMDVQESVMRLASSAAALAAKIQFVLTAHGSRLDQIDQRIRDRIDVRIDLERWDNDDIQEFLLAALPDVKDMDKVFTAEAIAGLQRRSCGVSQKVRQLVQLALLGAELRESPDVDSCHAA
jgi:general secretion pathway protein A